MLKKSLSSIGVKQNKTRFMSIFLVLSLLFVSTLLVSPLNVQAAGINYYVSATGSDTNNGLSSSSPFQTIQKAADLTLPGDTVFIMNGTYGVPTGASSALVINRSGNATGWITYKNYPGHSPKIYVPKTPGNWQGILVEAANYIVIDGLELMGDNANLTLEEGMAVHDHYKTATTIDWNYVATTNTNGILIRQNKTTGVGSTHVTVRNCYIHEFPGAGIGTEFVDYMLFENNIVRANAWYTLWACSGISVFHPINSDSNTTTYKNIIRNNISYDNETFVPWADQNKYSDGNGIIVDDTLNTQLRGAKAYTGKTLVENNVSYNNGGGGINIFSSKNVDVMNNTVYNNSRSSHLNYSNLGISWSTSCTARNNIVYTRAGEPTNSTELNTNVVYDYNIYYSGLAPAVMGANDVIADPKFMNAGSADFHLQATSPAINTGTSTNAPATDIEGTSRPFGAGIDRGAYEYTGAATPVPTATPTPDPNATPTPTPTATPVPTATPTPTPVAGPNLVLNGSFETSTLDNWTKIGTSPMAESYLPFEGTCNASFKKVDGISQTVSGLLPNTTYRLTAYLNSYNSGNPVYLKVNNYGGSELSVSHSTNTYTQKEVIFTTGASNTSCTIVIVGGGTTNNNQFKIDAVSLVQQ